jgi:GntR family transcriptional regulator
MAVKVKSKMATRNVKVHELPISRVNPASPMPLYFQIEADLRALLTSRYVNVGDLLPTEQELAAAYGVGRHTMRTALSRLANDQLIVRKAGHGTVVRNHADRKQFSLDRSFTRQMQEMGMTAHSKVLHMETRTVLGTDPRPLLPKLGMPCMVLDRLRFGGDEPIGLQRSYVLLEHCPSLPNRDFATHSLYDILSNEFHLVITQITHTVTAAVADRRQADQLGIKAQSALLVVNTSAWLDSRDLIEFSLGHYRADKYEYSTTQTL